MPTDGPAGEPEAQNLQRPGERAKPKDGKRPMAKRDSNRNFTAVGHSLFCKKIILMSDLKATHHLGQP
jgi:hypothetical protein